LLEDSKRDDATVLVLQLPVTADENSIYQYFKSGNCGKINDIRIIRDARSQKSKGIAYVEFYLQESILKVKLSIISTIYFVLQILNIF